MSVDKFGRHESSIVREVLRGPPGEGFQLTHDGHYDLKRKRVCNIADPIHNEEAVNLKTIRTLTLNCESNGDTFDAKNKRIENVANAEKDTDAVNRRYVLQEINKLKRQLRSEILNLSPLVRPSNKDDIGTLTGDGNSIFNRRHGNDGPITLMTSNELTR